MQEQSAPAGAQEEMRGAAPTGDNPLLAPFDAPFGLPPLDRISPEHFRPAFERALAEQTQEIAGIRAQVDAPSFDNTIGALERSGRLLRRVAAVFFNLSGAHTNPALQEVERAIAPVLARHRSQILMDPALFARVETLARNPDGYDLDAEQRQVLARYHTAFVRAGAALDPASRMRMAQIAERLAALGTAFSQNVLADEQSYALVLEGEADLAGLPDFVRTAAAQAAKERDLPGRHVITMARSSIEPFLQFSARRDLRERAFAAWTARGDGGGATDNKAIISETLALRAERARLLGFANFAAFKLDDSMAKTPANVARLLADVWTPARERALRDRARLQSIAAAEGGNFTLAASDWRYYSEKLRKAEFDFDEAELKPYFQLDNLIAAAFDVAHRLFGLTFTEKHGLPSYHPDVRVFDVTGRGGSHVGLFLGDYFARSTKRSGAWMSAFRGQEKLDRDIRPIVVNVMNFSKGGDGAPALLSFDDARTLFHEFGHALHGLLSDVTYPMISGTNVARDFVEFPSQLYEHWLEQPEVLRRFARHCDTGEPLPMPLVERLKAARNFNQGHATVEYVASAMVDLDFHLLQNAEGVDVAAFERESLARIGMPAEIVMRHRPTHFAHVFAGDGYAAGYYSYLWSEVMDADGFRAFEEAGDMFDPETARRLHDFVYSAGYRQDPAAAYTAFRGRMPTVDALLRKRGLAV